MTPRRARTAQLLVATVLMLLPLAAAHPGGAFEPIACGAAASTAATASSVRSWWSELPGGATSVAPAPAPRWTDALDVYALLQGSSAGPDARVAVTVRTRLDAPAYLERLRAEADDLTTLALALARERHHAAQLRWLAERCEARWRAHQRRLIDALLRDASATGQPSGGAADDPFTGLRLLRELLGDGPAPTATADDVVACRLDAVLAQLRLAPDHPHLVADAAERRLAARGAALIDAPLPASVWLEADALTSRHGSAARVRIGLDMPVGAPGASLAVSADTNGVQAELRYHRDGAAARPRHRPTDDAAHEDPAWLEQRLREQVRVRRLEAELARFDAGRQWLAACGTCAPDEVITCLQRAPADAVRVERLLGAIDAERIALSAALAAVDVSGWPLGALVRLPGLAAGDALRHAVDDTAPAVP